MESTGTLQWREAVLGCQTLSRMHLLVGMFDSCIKWEKSVATKVKGNYIPYVIVCYDVLGRMR